MVTRLTALLLALASVAQAHPGRLGVDGCHVVRKPFVSRDGTRLEAGSRHCHRRLDQGMRLEDVEMLRDADEAHQPDPDDYDAAREAP